MVTYTHCASFGVFEMVEIDHSTSTAKFVEVDRDPYAKPNPVRREFREYTFNLSEMTLIR